MKDAFMRKTGIHRKIRSSLKSNKEALMRDKMNKRKAGKSAYKSGITLERKILLRLVTCVSTYLIIVRFKMIFLILLLMNMKVSGLMLVAELV